MKRLVIVGNGFDIAHGLHTKYLDFEKYLCSYEKEPRIIAGRFVLRDSVSLEDQKKHCFYDAISKYIPKQELWSSFEEALGMLDYEQLMDDNSDLLIGYGDDDWRDSAHHDFQYMVEENLSFASEIQNYFKKWINVVDTSCNYLPRVKEIIDRNCLFLNFNYTDTLEKVYNIPEDRILYIHGKALRGDNLILGHHNNTLFQCRPGVRASEEYDDIYNIYPEDIRVTEGKSIVKSYFQKTYKNTSDIIKKNQNFFSKLLGVTEIYILGHSLSDIDIEYFCEIKRNVPSSCCWNISYHNNLDYQNVKSFIHKLGIRRYQKFYF